MDPLNLISVAFKPLGLLLSHFYNRPRLKVSPRYIPKIDSYIIEVVNSGNKATTITAVGISGLSGTYSTGYKDHVWVAEELFPKRLQERDCAYFCIWWEVM